MANPRGATLRPGLWQSNVLTPVGGAHFIRGPRGGPLPGNAFQAKGGEEEEVPPSQNLWVGNVTSEITEPMLMERFVKFGEINSISLYPLRNYAFVYFKHIEHAKAAKEGLQGAAMGDSFLKIEFARAAKPNKYLWVGGIMQTVTKEQIEAEFLKFGHVEDLKLFRDRNSAIVAYSKLEDAVSAVKYLNGRQLGSDPIRVDFLRSQSLKRENAVNPNFHADEARDVHANNQRMLMGMSDLVRKYSDTVTCQPEPLIGMQVKTQNVHGIEGGRKQCSPSKILWIRYPDSVNIDEQRLHNSLILFGEIERIKSFPSRHYAFVEFRSVDEARRAKDGSQGRLLNDPRIQILYSSSEFGPMENSKDNSTFVTQFCGSLPHETPSRSGSQFGSIERFGPVGIIDSSNPAGTNVGPRGFDEHHAAEGRISLSRPDMFNNFLDVNVNSPGPGSWGKPPPPTDIGLRPVRPLSSSWDGFDANAAQRELKKPRIDVNNANTGALDARTPVQGAIGPQPFRGFSGYVNTNSDNQITGQRGNPGSYLNGGDRLAVGPCHMAPMPSARTQSLQGQGEHFGRVEENICWQGTIAKGGTPVCHARCISVGKSIESKFPEVVNCSARTDLDMLTKHFSQASGFGLVFFVPEQDQDVHPYQEFLRYLGSKHRAGVAKFSDGTTLFLVPPSDFSEHVLKAPRGNHLFGVVLKFLQQSGSVMQPNPSQTNLHDPLQQLYVQSEQFPISHVGYTQMPIKGDPTICATGMPRSLSPPEDMHSGQTAVPERINQIPGTQSAAISLTPELIATLTSLLPNTFQASSSGGSAAVPNTSTRHDPCDSSGGYDGSDNRRLGSSPRSSELWRQHQQPLPLTSHIPRQEHDSEQHHRQHNSQTSFHHLAASSLSNSNSTLEHSVHGAAVSQLFQDPNQKGQQSYPLSRITTGHAQLPSVQAQSSDSHSGQLTMLHANQNRIPEACFNSQRSYSQMVPMEVSENIQSSASPQQKSVSLRSPDPVQGGGGSQTFPNVQLGSNEGNPQLASQVQQLQGLGASLLGHGQENSKGDTDKNQRYQSTLQFAANLLIQLQQKQAANKNVMGSSQHQQ